MARGQDVRKFQLDAPLQNGAGNDILLHQKMKKGDDAGQPRPHRGDA